MPPVPGMLVAYGRFTATELGQAEIIYIGEGLERRSPCPAHQRRPQLPQRGQGAGVERAAGHAAAADAGASDDARAEEREVGAGDRMRRGRHGGCRLGPVVERETIAEIEPLVPRVVSTYFAEHNFDVVRNPKVSVHIDDGRHFLLTTKDKFDAVTSDPLDPWVKGAAMLYTREFFELVKQHLNPGRRRDAVRAAVREQHRKR